MINELKDRLLKLFDRRPRGASGKPRPSELRNFILVTPELIERVRAWSDRPEMSPQAKRLSGMLASYAFLPSDLIPDDEGGLRGYLDDAYLAARAYEYCANRIGPDAAAAPRAAEFAVQIPVWLALARKVIPQEAKKIDAMLERHMNGDPAAFDALLAEIEAARSSRAARPAAR